MCSRVRKKGIHSRARHDSFLVSETGQLRERKELYKVCQALLKRDLVQHEEYLRETSSRRLTVWLDR